jgi:hypothetical protein
MARVSVQLDRAMRRQWGCFGQPPKLAARLSCPGQRAEPGTVSPGTKAADQPAMAPGQRDELQPASAWSAWLAWADVGLPDGPASGVEPKPADARPSAPAAEPQRSVRSSSARPWWQARRGWEAQQACSAGSAARPWGERPPARLRAGLLGQLRAASPACRTKPHRTAAQLRRSGQQPSSSEAMRGES